MNLYSAAAVISVAVLLAWTFGPSRYEIVTRHGDFPESYLIDRRDGRIWRKDNTASLPGYNPAWFEMPRLDSPKDFHAASRDRWLTGYRSQVQWRYEDAKRRREVIEKQRDAVAKRLEESENRDFQAEFKRRLELAKQEPHVPNDVALPPGQLPPIPDELLSDLKLTPEEHARTFPSETTRRLREEVSRYNNQMESALIDENRF